MVKTFSDKTNAGPCSVKRSIDLFETQVSRMLSLIFICLLSVCFIVYKYLYGENYVMSGKA